MWRNALILAAVLVASPVAAQEEAPRQVLITNVDVWDGTSDNVMSGVESFWIVNENDDRIVAFSIDGTGSAAGTAYLGTFTALISNDAAGTLQVGLVTDPDQLIVGDADGSPYGVEVTPGSIRIIARDMDR